MTDSDCDILKNAVCEQISLMGRFRRTVTAKTDMLFLYGDRGAADKLAVFLPSSVNAGKMIHNRYSFLKITFDGVFIVSKEVYALFWERSSG